MLLVLIKVRFQIQSGGMDWNHGFGITNISSASSTMTYRYVPEGTMKGSITAKQNYMSTVHVATIYVFEKDTVNWTSVSGYRNVIEAYGALLQNIVDLKICTIVTNTDGTFKIDLLPGEYDILIDKSGYLDYIVTNIEVTIGAVINIGNKTIEAGDINKVGVVDGSDILAINAACVTGFFNSEERIAHKSSYDINGDGAIDGSDVLAVNRSASDAKCRVIE